MPLSANNNPGHGFGGPRYPGTFLLALREALARLNWEPITWKGGSVECVNPDGQKQHVGLENLYRRLRSERRERWPDLLAELLQSVPPDAGNPPGDLSEVAGQLLIRLGPPFKRDNPETDVWNHFLVDQCLAATLVIDYPSSMSYVTEKMIEDSGHDGPYWFERALDNLRAKSEASNMQEVHAETGLLQGRFGDAYDSSRALILDDLLPGNKENGFFVVAPGRDHLLVLPLTKKTLRLAPWLRAIAAKTYREMPYPISPELFWVRDGNWYHFAVDVQGEDILVQPPPEFADVLARLQEPDLDGPEPPADDSDRVPI